MANRSPEQDLIDEFVVHLRNHVDDNIRIAEALGCNVIEGRGSRVRFEYNGIITAFLRPHPAKESKPYQVEQARDFLTAIGVKP